MKETENNILPRKIYSKPRLTRIELDNTISLVMMTTMPPNPPPRGGGSKGMDEPFSSPFGDKPFG